MRRKKFGRRKQFLDVLEEIRNISNKIEGSAEYIPSATSVDETNLSLRKLEKLQGQLHAFQKGKVGTYFYLLFMFCIMSFMSSISHVLYLYLIIHSFAE